MGSSVSKSEETRSISSSMSFSMRQLFDDESSTYTYLLWDVETKDAVLIDPVDTQVERDLQVVSEEKLNLIFGINTHAHADHITGTGILKKKVKGLQSVISQASKAKADLIVVPGDTIRFGGKHLEVKGTPGHTEGCISLVSNDGKMVFTGDTLLVQGCGRTDFQGGSASSLYDSVHSQLFTLSDDCIVYPAHDYKGRLSSTIGDEKKNNPRLGGSKSKEEFVEIMKNLNLSYPKKIDVAVPANMRCGVPDIE